jgi:AcrR family transcriptional regulator
MSKTDKSKTDKSKTDKSKKENYHHGNLREALITNAVTILEDDGVEALTLRRVARDTGVSQAAPYSHFRDKKDLITAVCLEGTKWFGEYMSREAAGRAGRDYPRRLGHWSHTFCARSSLAVSPYEHNRCI